MALPEYHRRRLAHWRHALLVVPLLAVLLSEFLVGTRVARPDLFWGAVTLLAFFAAWAIAGAVWHYLVLSGINTDREVER